MRAAVPQTELVRYAIDLRGHHPRDRHLHPDLRALRADARGPARKVEQRGCGPSDRRRAESLRVGARDSGMTSAGELPSRSSKLPIAATSRSNWSPRRGAGGPRRGPPARPQRGRSARAARRRRPSAPQSSLAAKTAVGDDHGVQVGEQRSQRVLEHQRVAGGAGGGGHQHRRAVEGAGLEDVEERLEQARVGGAEDRGHGDHRVGARDGLDRRGQLAVGEAGQQGVGHRVRERAQLDDLDSGAAQRVGGRLPEQVGEQPRRGGLGEPSGDDGDATGVARVRASPRQVEVASCCGLRGVLAQLLDDLAEQVELVEHGLQRQTGVVDEEQLALVVAGVLAEGERALDDLLAACRRSAASRG